MAARHIFATLLGALVLVGSAPAEAAEPALQTSAAAMPKGAAQARYRQGREAYDAGRYEDAGAAWADALDQVPEQAKTRALRARMILDVMTAYRAAYDQTGDVALLEAGLQHYFRYFALYKETYSSPRIPREVVVARYELKNAIEMAKKNASDNTGQNGETGDSSGNGETEQEEGAAGQPISEGNNARDQGAAPAEARPASEERVNVSVSGGGPKDRTGTPLIAAGAAVLALGVGASTMIAVGAIEGQRAREDQKMPGFTDEQRDRIDQRGRSMNSLFIAGLVVTPVLVGAGAALIGVGAKRRRDHRGVAAAPAIGRSYVGVTLSGRF